MEIVTIAKNDYGKNLSWTLYQTDGVTPFNLITGYSVKLKVWQSSRPGSLLINGACTIVTPAAGTVTYTIAKGDFTQVGNFLAEFEASFSTTEITSFETFQITVVESG